MRMYHSEAFSLPALSDEAEKVLTAARQTAWYDQEGDSTYNPFRKLRTKRLSHQEEGIRALSTPDSLNKPTGQQRDSNSILAAKASTPIGNQSRINATAASASPYDSDFNSGGEASGDTECETDKVSDSTTRRKRRRFVLRKKSRKASEAERAESDKIEADEENQHDKTGNRISWIKRDKQTLPAIKQIRAVVFDS